MRLVTTQEAIEHIRRHRLRSGNLIKYVEAVHQEELTEYVIENREELELHKYEVKQLLRKTTPQFIRKALLDGTIFHKGDIELVQLIEETADREELKYYVINRELYGLNQSTTTDLLIKTKDQELMKKTIEEENFDIEYIMDIILTITDKEYITKCILGQNPKIKLGSNAIKRILRDYNDPQIAIKYIEKELEEAKKSETKKLNKETKSNILKIIENSRDINLLKYSLKRKNDLELTKEEIVELILLTRDNEYIKEQIKNAKKYDFEEKEIVLLKYFIGNKEAVEPYKKELKRKMESNPRQTSGIEIETKGQYSTIIRELLFKKPQEKKNGPLFYIFEDAEKTSWRNCYDSSLGMNVETKSPIMRSGEDREKEIVETCAFLESVGQHTDESCGAHIHIGADYLSSVQSYKNLLEMITNCEKILFRILTKEGESLRPGVVDYARPISRKIQEEIEKGNIDITNNWELDQLKKQLVEQQRGRKGYSVNFLNLATNSEKSIKMDTIEFRIPNGNTDPQTWIDNINLCCGIIENAEELYRIQMKTEHKRTEEEKEKLKNFEMLKTDISEDEKAERFLKIITKENTREVYKRRYEKNKKNKDISELGLNEYIAKKTTLLHLDDIKKTIEEGKMTQEELDKIMKNIDDYYKARSRFGEEYGR